MQNALKLIIAALVLLVIGVMLPFLMILDLIGATIFLNFIAYGASITGFVLGFAGVAQYMRGRK